MHHVRKRKSDVPEIGPPEPLTRERGISRTKQEDLLCLCDKILIPTVYHDFFKRPSVGSMTADNDDNQEDQ